MGEREVRQEAMGEGARGEGGGGGALVARVPDIQVRTEEKRYRIFWPINRISLGLRTEFRIYHKNESPVCLQDD